MLTNYVRPAERPTEIHQKGGISMTYQLNPLPDIPRKSYQFLTGTTLKWIAVILMLIDHIGAVIVAELSELGYILPAQEEAWIFCYKVLRNIGRSSFPIFCFLLVEGFCHTSSKGKYALRLFAFALISQMPYELAIWNVFEWKHTNVFFTLLIGLLTIWGMAEADKRIRDTFFSVIIKALCIATGCMAAYIIKSDYKYNGVLLIVILYAFRFWPTVAGTAGYVFLLLRKKGPYALPGFLLMQCYNGERGKGSKYGKYAFYIFYPAHLLLLYFIREYIL